MFLGLTRGDGVEAKPRVDLQTVRPASCSRLAAHRSQRDAYARPAPRPEPPSLDSRSILSPFGETDNSSSNSNNASALGSHTASQLASAALTSADFLFLLLFAGSQALVASSPGAVYLPSRTDKRPIRFFCRRFCSCLRSLSLSLSLSLTLSLSLRLAARSSVRTNSQPSERRSGQSAYQSARSSGS